MEARWRGGGKSGSGERCCKRESRFADLRACSSLDYDDKVLKGTIDLTTSTTFPIVGTAYFHIHTPGRIFFFHAENDDVTEALSWVRVRVEGE